MDSLKERIRSVSDYYYDFERTVEAYVCGDKEKADILMDYIFSNPDATTSDILKYILDHPAFMAYEVEFVPDEKVAI